jgi:protein pelota
MKYSLQKLKSGTAIVTPENDDDLWVLSQIIDQNDQVRGRTLRKVKIGGEDQRNAKVSRKPMTLSISAEKIEFGGEQLRVLGQITSGPDDISLGEHHSFTIEAHDTIQITKQHWPSYQLEKLKQAKHQAKTVLLCVFDREEATFAVHGGRGFIAQSSLKGNMPRKIDQQHASSDFFDEISDVLHEYVKRYEPDVALLASPAFWKDYLLKHVKDKGIIDEKRIITGTISTAGERGIAEALNRPELKAALMDVRAAQETKMVEALLVALATDKPVSYGLQDCKAAAQAGAIKIVLVSETYLAKKREEGNTIDIEEVMKVADQMQAEVHLIGEHEAGKKLEGLGGIAALLRFPIN